MPGKLPDFLIVGAAKSGTTSLWRYLNEHPEVFMSRKKEPLFFISEYIRTLDPEQPGNKYLIAQTVHEFEEYEKLFEEAGEAKARGEASVGYLSSAHIAAPNIKSIAGDIKIVMVLRNPVDRAYSAYTHQVLLGVEDLSFEEALAKEGRRREKNHNPALYYVHNGFYAQRVKLYLDNFSKVKICLFDDLKSKGAEVVKDLFAFLDVDGSFVPDTERKYNVSGVPKNKLLQKFLHKPYLSDGLAPLVRPIYRMLPESVRHDTIPKLISNLKARNVEKFEMRPETRQRLKEIYRQDILELQELLNRDLSRWAA